MKKFAIGITALLMAAAAVTPVAAAEDKRDAVITTEIAPAYIVTIPSDLQVPFNSVNTDFGAVELTQAQLEPNKCVKVTLETDGLLENQADTTKTLPYAINQGKSDNVGDAFTTASYLAAGDKTDLTVTITQEDWNKAYAGQYSDTVTFNIEYTAK